MKPQFGDSKFDYRTRQRALREGTLKKEDLTSYLKDLPDETSRSQEIPVYEETTIKETTQNKSSGNAELEPTFSAGNEA